MKKEKELLDNYLKGWCDGKREGQNSQKEKDLEDEITWIESLQKDIRFMQPNCIEAFYRIFHEITNKKITENKQKIKGEKKL
jgi:hypothetical protein